jgi:hypothetical protein
MTQISGMYQFRQLPPTAVWTTLLDPSLLPQAIPHPVQRTSGLVYQQQGEFLFRAHVEPFAEHSFVLRLHLLPGERGQSYELSFTVQDVAGEGHELHGRGVWQLTSHQQDTLAHYQLETTHTSGEFAEVGDLLVQTMLRSGIRQTLQGLEAWLQAQGGKSKK